jgi:FKBP-type peptidyl-prolyl cis-trans isomerase
MIRSILIIILASISWLSSFAQDTTRTFSGLQYVVLEEGDGREAYANRKVTVSYVGRFEDGTVFDSSSADNFQFVTGHGQVIKGWDEGIRLMSEGSKYLFIIPPKLAYGKKGYHDIIPPNATLYFEVRLIKVENL